MDLYIKKIGNMDIQICIVLKYNYRINFKTEYTSFIFNKQIIQFNNKRKDKFHGKEEVLRCC